MKEDEACNAIHRRVIIWYLFVVHSDVVW